MKEKSTNKTTNNSNHEEMLEDYSTVLTNSHIQKALRGKYSQLLKNSEPSKVKIIRKNGEQYVNMKTIEVEVLVNKGELTVQIPSNLKEGKYKAVLIVEIPNLDD